MGVLSVTPARRCFRLWLSARLDSCRGGKAKPPAGRQRYRSFRELAKGSSETGPGWDVQTNQNRKQPAGRTSFPEAGLRNLPVEQRDLEMTTVVTR